MIEKAITLNNGNLVALCTRTDPKQNYAVCDYCILAREEFSTDEGAICGASVAKCYMGQREAVNLALFILDNLAEVYYIEEAIEARNAVKKLAAKYNEEPKE